MVADVAWVALSLVPGVGGMTMRRLLARFGSLDAILAASEDDLIRVDRIGPKTAQAIRSVRLDRVERLLLSLAGEGISVLAWHDSSYPANLRPLVDAPPLLFFKGHIMPADEAAVAVVGTRSPGQPSLRAAERIAGELADRGITVISGLAIGVDARAHRGALAAGGRTIAVLGSGLRAIHPSSNRRLAKSVAGSGALLSELHPDAGPTATQLVARDRIISGLSRWVIVVESGVTGGSMRTAAFARRQGRTLAAVPGSPGTDALLGAGAERLEEASADWDALAERIRETALRAEGPASGLASQRGLPL